MPGLVKYLLARGVDPNIQDNRGNQPLHYALAKDCDVALGFDHSDRQLIEAVSCVSPFPTTKDIVKTLLDGGADPDSETRSPYLDSMLNSHCFSAREMSTLHSDASVKKLFRPPVDQKSQPAEKSSILDSAPEQRGDSRGRYSSSHLCAHQNHR
jgi:hypothetical protein